MDKKVLVTGHSGFKGSWLSILLTYLGAKVYGYSLEPPTNPAMFYVAKVNEIVETKFEDIRNFDSLKGYIERVQPEIVFHLAAQPLVRESYINPICTYAVNVIGTANLLEVCRSIHSIKSIVNITTDKCYENKEWHWGYREDEPLGGFDPYSSSKACAELVTSAYRNSFFFQNSEYKLGLATARAGNVIGGGDWAKDRLIPDFFRAISNKEMVKIRSPFSIRPWQHVLEPLFGYIILSYHLYQDRNRYSEAWNFGPNDADAKDVKSIVEKICECWGDASYEIDNGSHPHEATYLKLDCSKAKAELGWCPVWTVDKALEKIVEWNRAFLNDENMYEITVSQVEAFIKDTYQ